MASSAHAKFISAKLTCGLLVAAWLYAFWPTIRVTVLTYITSSFNYQGLLVLPLILMAISKNASSLNRSPQIYNPYGLLLLLASVIVWLFAAITELKLVAQVAIISMLISIVVTTCGKKVTNIILLPLLCLYLLLPIGSDLFKAASQLFSTTLVKALSVSYESVYWESKHVYINNNSYDIHTYLSSLKFIMIFVAMGCSFALLRTKNLMTFMCIASSFVIMPVIILWLTLYSFILFNNIWDPVTLSQKSVLIISWVCTILGLIHAIILSNFVGEKSYLLRASEDIDWHARYGKIKTNWVLPLIMASTIILMAPILERNLYNSQHYGNTDSMLSQPNELPDWNGSKVQYSFSNSESQNESGWKQIKQSSKKIIIKNKSIKVQETILRSQNKQYKIVWTINYINGHLTNSATLAKALLKIYTLTPKGARAGVITMSTQVKDDINIGRNTLNEYMQKMAIGNNLEWLK
jgi:hypothetical protein